MFVVYESLCTLYLRHTMVGMGLHYLLIGSGFRGPQSLYRNRGKLCRTLELSKRQGNLYTMIGT